MPSKKIHTVLIEKLVPGGLGLGRLDEGIVVFVRHVLPGEKVVVRELNRKKDFVSAVLHEILTPSPDRIKPPCPHYGRCGGCDLQHVSYKTQIHLKKEILTASLLRAGNDIFSEPQRFIQPALASPKEFGYRQRIRLQVDDEGKSGFFRSGSHALEPVDECLLAREDLNSALRLILSNVSFAELTGRSTAFELLFNPDGGDIIVLLHYRRKPRPSDFSLAAGLTETTDGISSILIQAENYGLYDPQAGALLSKPRHLSQTVSIGSLQTDLQLTWEAAGFCQVNLEQNNNLVELVLKMLKTGPHMRILDLFCGYGNFSLPAAKFAEEVVGIDSQNAAIRSARKNMELNGIPNCRFIKSSVETGVDALISTGQRFDTVILDPPRQGAAAVVSRFTALEPKQIIYISCNPATLARDLALLLASGYELSHLIPADMFPQTHHLESVSLLKRLSWE
ncbi:MAG: 23S rRNA (uracil(1939)-C(5))-methyltransferase RlmD [Deltaproteobacteria bacterium]|jgi:23S rRNA (uracil1939-C5)-methyltransferase|nr:23S rRNA (uracil(1939)-C(5))-methyltransferase RlmD [Deltaproteobacteria bacterium]